MLETLPCGHCLSEAGRGVLGQSTHEACQLIGRRRRFPLHPLVQEQFARLQSLYNLGAETTMKQCDPTNFHLLSENSTGSSPVMSMNCSFQSSSHVLAYPSSNRTSRHWRMPTVAIRSSRTVPSQRHAKTDASEGFRSLTKHRQRLSDTVGRSCGENMGQNFTQS